MQEIPCLCKFCAHTVIANDSDFPAGVPVNGVFCKGCKDEACQKPSVKDGVMVFKRKDKVEDK